MTPSDKLGVHPFHWLVCWQIECPCLQPCVTRAGATCVWLDQQVAGTLASVILKPLFIHNSSLGVQQKPSFPPQKERTGDRQHPWLFSNSRNRDYTPLYTRHVLFWNYWPKCKSRVLILCKRGSWKCEVISNFSAPNPPLFSILCVCIVCVNSCLSVYRATTGPNLEPQECEITSTRGISRLYRAEKIYFLSEKRSPFPSPTNFVYFPLLTDYLFPNHTIKWHHYIWVPTGTVCPGLLMLTTPACFIAVINGTRCIIRKRQTALFLFGGQPRWQEINAQFPMST